MEKKRRKDELKKNFPESEKPFLFIRKVKPNLYLYVIMYLNFKLF